MWQANFDIIDEIEWGKNNCMKMRLTQTHKKKSRTIQKWSSLSKDWITMYRYKVDENWKWWKNYANLYSKRHKNSR